jgi:hypothetical protein
MICIFRNFCIVKVETVADKDGVKCRVNGTSDITRDIAEAMGWEIMHSQDGVLTGLAKTTLKGEMNLSKLSLIPNGAKQGQIEDLPVSVARNFKLSVSEGEEGSTDDVILQFIITAPPTSAKRLIDYHLRFGCADAQLKLEVVGEAQAKLDLAPSNQMDLEPDDDEPEEEEEDEDSEVDPAPAQTLPRMPRRDRSRKVAPITPDTEGVPFA